MGSKVWQPQNRDKTHRHREQSRVCQRGGVGAGVDWEFGVGGCKLLYMRCMNSKVLLYSTGNCIQSPGIKHNGKEYLKKRVYICVTESIGCPVEIDTTL